MEHLTLSALLSTDSEVDWITNLLLINQSYHIIQHYSYMRRLSGDNDEKFRKVHEKLEKDRLKILNELLKVKNAYASKSNNKSEENVLPFTNADGSEPKRRGRKPKPKLPTVDDLIQSDIK